MKIAAYCRVSTDKADQLNSLEAQKEFFSEYTQRTGDVLVKLYADEGISGTKIKNRKEFLRMMSDAEKGMFDMACRDFAIDMEHSYMVGDRAGDIIAGQNIGIRTILLESGYGTARLEKNVKPNFIFEDLTDVIKIL